MAVFSCLDHLCSVGPLACGWTTCVRLDHLRALGPPYFVNQVVQRNLSGPTAFKWSKQASRVTTCETPSHHAGRPVGRSRCGTPEPPRRPTARAARLPGPDDPSEPDRPRRPARRSRRPPGAGGRRSHGPADPLDAEGPAGITTAPRDSTASGDPPVRLVTSGPGRGRHRARPRGRRGRRRCGRGLGRAAGARGARVQGAPVVGVEKGGPRERGAHAHPPPRRAHAATTRPPHFVRIPQLGPECIAP